jgi:hypothetical protein
MTNVELHLNINSNDTVSDGNIFEDKFHSRTDGDIIFPKVRTALVEEGVKTITFEVDFRKLNEQLSLYQFNSK